MLERCRSDLSDLETPVTVGNRLIGVFGGKLQVTALSMKREMVEEVPEPVGRPLSRSQPKKHACARRQRGGEGCDAMPKASLFAEIMLLLQTCNM